MSKMACLDPELPFRTRLKSRWMPKEMREAPVLDRDGVTGLVRKSTALLINPFYPKAPHSSFGKHVLTPTLALTSVAGATPENWEVSYWDENLLLGHPPRNPVPEVVGITVHLTFAERAYELARWYRARGSKIVLGGLHVLSCPDENKPHADAIAIGDGVQLWPRILKDVEEGNLQKVYQAMYETDFSEDPAPNRKILRRSGYLTTSSFAATRGCHNRCGYCYLATSGLRMPYRVRKVEQVVEEFRGDGQPYGVFLDNNLASQPDYLKSLCRALRPVKKIWSAAVTLDVTDDPATVREMALAGCNGVFVGFESLSDANLKQARKRTPRTDEYARRVKIFHDHGIQVNGSFVLGFDGDRKDVFSLTADWIEANRLESATFHILTPYPGTPLFRQMESEGRLLHRDWNLYDTAHVVFQPRNMTPEELLQGYGWIYQRLFSAASIWKRRPEDPRALLPHLAMSYLYKRANWFWYALIRTNQVNTFWRPLMEWNRRRHLKFRERLEHPEEWESMREIRPESMISAGV